MLVWLKSCIVVNPLTEQLNIENRHKQIKRVEMNSFYNPWVEVWKLLIFTGEVYIIEAGKFTAFEQFARNKRSICNLFYLLKGVWVNSRSHKLWRLLRQGVTWFALRKSDVEIGLTILLRLITNSDCRWP